MKIKIKKKQLEYDTVEVEPPYFYRNDYNVQYGSRVRFGCIEPHEVTSIDVSVDSSGKKNVEIVIEPIDSEFVPLSYSSYFETLNKSDKGEFLAAVSEAMETLQSILNEHGAKS